MLRQLAEALNSANPSIPIYIKNGTTMIPAHRCYLDKDGGLVIVLDECAHHKMIRKALAKGVTVEVFDYSTNEWTTPDQNFFAICEEIEAADEAEVRLYGKYWVHVIIDGDEDTIQDYTSNAVMDSFMEGIA